MRGRVSRGARAAPARCLVWAALLGILSLGAHADDLAPERRAEALDLLRHVEGLKLRPSMRTEDLVVSRETREKLAEEGSP